MFADPSFPVLRPLVVQVVRHAIGRDVARLLYGGQFVALVTLAHVSAQVVRGRCAECAPCALEGRTEMPNCDVALEVEGPDGGVRAVRTLVFPLCRVRQAMHPQPI